MKKITIIIAAIIMMAGFTTKSMAQLNSSTSTTANPTAVAARVVSALTITESASLHFGTMTRPTDISTVTVSAAGSRSKSGTVELLSQTPTFHQAGYTVAGDINAFYTINVPTTEVKIYDGVTHDNDMVVDSWTTTKNLNKSQLSAAGADTFGVGATLNLAANQPSGLYTGTFSITVMYN